MCIQEKKQGFAPVFNRESRVLILGSFPSVKSRAENFYYGNKQNRFWHMLANFFQVELPTTIDEKKALLLKKNIAVWDIVASCNIEGSLDSNIQNYTLVDLLPLFEQSKVHTVLCNGATAYKFYMQKYKNLPYPCHKMPSTSPANTRFCVQDWYTQLAKI